MLTFLKLTIFCPIIFRFVLKARPILRYTGKQFFDAVCLYLSFICVRLEVVRAFEDRHKA